jgi:hypothetical protein
MRSPSSTPSIWHRLEALDDKGFYSAHQDVDLHGYWIYRTDANQCWQVQGGTCGPLTFWNKDGRAQGNPDNWELFNFVAVNKNQGTVK